MALTITCLITTPKVTLQVIAAAMQAALLTFTEAVFDPGESTRFLVSDCDAMCWMISQKSVLHFHLLYLRVNPDSQTVNSLLNTKTQS